MRIPAQDRVRLIKQAIKNGMKILSYDIETSHMVVKIFHIGECHVGHTAIQEPSKVISIQYMLSSDKKATALKWCRMSNFHIKGWDDSKIIKEFALNILPTADIVLTQNGDSFDYKTLNDRAMLLQLPLLDQKPSIDILKLSRKSFRAASHKLDFRSSRVGLGGKMKMVEQDWFDVEEGKIDAGKKMIPYGCKDTEDTLKLFWRELPYYKDLPVAVEQVILKFCRLTDPDLGFKQRQKYKKTLSKVRCRQCSAKRQKATNIKHIKNNTYHCLNCKGFFGV